MGSQHSQAHSRDLIPREAEGAFAHFPALLPEVVYWLRPQPGQLMVDATLGMGGHAEALLERLTPGGRLVALDADPDALRLAAVRLARFGQSVVLCKARFSQLADVLRDLKVGQIDGLLADLGLSERQIRSPRFSFRATGPLDFRIDPDLRTTAADLLEQATPAQIAEWLRVYGEEPMANAIAVAIVRQRRVRPLRTIEELVKVIERAVPPDRRPRGKHVATRTFQALRIVVNREMEELDALLTELPRWTKPGARVAILAYHSLEDRRVKRAFQREARGCICPPDLPMCGCGRRPRFRILTPHPIRPTAEEVTAHRTARTARLRVAERLFEPTAGGESV